MGGIFVPPLSGGPDHGHHGVAFWAQGGAIEITNNMSYGTRREAYGLATFGIAPGTNAESLRAGFYGNNALFDIKNFNSKYY